MKDLSEKQIIGVIKTWTEEYCHLGKEPLINHVQIENRGEIMGTSCLHPHGQIWATEHLPTIVVKEQVSQEKYLSSHKSSLLFEYLNYA